MILVTGATGTTGSDIIKQLAAVIKVVEKVGKEEPVTFDQFAREYAQAFKAV